MCFLWPEVKHEPRITFDFVVADESITTPQRSRNWRFSRCRTTNGHCSNYFLTICSNFFVRNEAETFLGAVCFVSRYTKTGFVIMARLTIRRSEVVQVVWNNRYTINY